MVEQIKDQEQMWVEGGIYPQPFMETGTLPRVAIYAPQPDDAVIYCNLACDEELTKHLWTGIEPLDPDRVLAEWKAINTSNRGQVFAVQAAIPADQVKVFGDQWHRVGIVGLYDINWVYGRAEFRVFIGPTLIHNKGIGTALTKMMLVYGFDKLNLHKIWLGVNAEDLKAVRAYQKAGFKEEGRLREEIYRNGRYYDAIRMAVLWADELRKRFYEELGLKEQ